ncbi:MAG: M64 family metallopeptidase, partial [Prolixibacteraceae bacterium]|nr:M64 family metallopeptidase [Prolixibacteraceae bacterium]
TFNYGTYRFRVFDYASGNLIYSRGFCNLFQEWQTTPGAKERYKTFYQAVMFPFPKNVVRLEIDARQWNGRFKTIFKTEIDPGDYFILREQVSRYESVTILENGKPEEKVDIVILAEGYTEEEMNKFLEDARKVSGYLFEEEPFKSEKSKFNIRAVMTPSQDSGTDIPGEGIYKNTLFNSSFYTFDVPRYLTTSDMKTIYDAAAVVPYDHICLLVNTNRYGGGGFYNFLSVCSSDNQSTREVFIHEFGHGFAGLGDEYYDSSVAYENYYNLKVEPWEPNLTTLVDFNKKWKSMIDSSVPVPTPRESKYSDAVGVFEGGGYIAKGIYSPVMNCRMKSNSAPQFCPVCSNAIRKMIDFHCK